MSALIGAIAAGLTVAFWLYRSWAADRRTEKIQGAIGSS
jgi:uncharacterized membrane protein